MAARSSSFPPTVTVKAPAAGVEPGSRPPSKVTVNAVPFTAAEENAGGVLLARERVEVFTSLPDRSRSRLAPAPVGLL